MPEIRKSNLPDGRSLSYDPQRLNLGGIVTEAFYLGQQFSDMDLRLWVRDHGKIQFKAFDAGSILTGKRLVDEDELKYLISTCYTAQDQFFDQALQVTLEN